MAARDWFRTFFDREYVELLKESFAPAATRRQAAFVAKALRLKRGQRVLDVCCGYGRHSGLLARRGFLVTGIDASRDMLAEARRAWRGVRNPRFLRMDMRRLPFRGEFDGAVCLFTSFGYFSDADNRRALRAMVGALKPGGRLVIETMNLERFKVQFKPRHWEAVGRRLVLMANAWEPRTRTIRSAWTIVTPGRGRVWRRENRLRAYSVAEFRRMLSAAGARLEAVYGDLDGSPYRGAGSRRLAVLARRAV